jgi:uncharacterized membrane protein
MADLELYIGYVGRAMEIMGVLILLFGTLIALTRFILTNKKSGVPSYKNLRHELGKTILLGLEVLIAGDIIASVVADQTMEKVLTLGLIILIRTFLSLSIEVEIEGRFPWQKPRK